MAQLECDPAYTKKLVILDDDGSGEFEGKLQNGMPHGLGRCVHINGVC